MSAISDFLNSAFSELFYDKDSKLGQVSQPPVQEPAKKEKEPFQKKQYDSMPETISATGSLADFDRVLRMLESGDTRTKNRAMNEMEGISDENRLACIAIFSRNQDARRTALKMVCAKPSVLAIIFSESLFRETRNAAMDELSGMLDAISDQKVLAVIACSNRDRRARMRAVGSVKEIKWLLDIAYSSKYEDSRWEAIAKLRSQRVDIDREDLRHDDTLTGLADQLVKSSTPEDEVMEDMEAMLENVRYLRNAARGRRNDEFGDIIRSNTEAYLNALMSIATASRHSNAREVALKGMDDDMTMLAEVAQHAEYEDTAEMAVDMMASSMSGRMEPQCLELVASMSESSDKRSRAVSKLDNAQMLKHIVKYSLHEDSRIAAAHKLASMISDIDDAESLRLVIAYAKESKNRELAERRIAELEGTQKKKAPEARPAPPAAEAKKPQKKEPPKAEPQKPVEARPPPLRREPESFGNAPPSGGLWGMLRELIGI